MVAVVAAAALTVGSPLAGGDAEVVAAEALTATPIVRLHEGRIVACGIGLTATTTARAAASAGAPVAAELVNERVGDGSVLRLTVETAAAVPSTGASSALATRTHDTARLLPAPTVTVRDGRTVLMAVGPVDPTAGAFLMQELAVGGGVVRVAVTADASGPTAGRAGVVHEAVIPGPLPQSVRAAYLACAGDLFPRTR
jgi:hypothetical protein